MESGLPFSTKHKFKYYSSLIATCITLIFTSNSSAAGYSDCTRRFQAGTLGVGVEEKHVRVGKGEYNEGMGGQPSPNGG